MTHRLVRQPSSSFAALADPTRLTISERLAARPVAVGELARDLPVSRPAVSQHLRVLKEAGLAVDVSAGRRRIYRLDPRGIGEMRDWLDRLWGDALDAFKDYVDEHSEEEGPE